MPFSYAQYPGNGSTVTFTVPFPYLLRAHVKLYYGLSLQSGGYTQLLVDGVNYSWTSATQVQLTAAPVVGQTLSIRRETPTTSRLVDWNDGSALTADALDTADLQNFYAIQEHKDYIEALSINPSTNVADGSITANKLSSDAVTTIKIQDQAVTTAKIADQAVTTGKIADGAIVNADVNANAGIVASKLSFTQSGTGATARTVENKLRDVLSVKDFGAVGDGVADDTAAIQAAATAAVAQGKTLFIPKTSSFYNVPNGAITLTLADNTGLVIESDGAELRLTNSNGGGIIRTLSVSALTAAVGTNTFVSINGLVLDGRGVAEQWSETNFANIKLAYGIDSEAEYIKVSDCRFNQIFGYGIRAAGPYRATFVNNSFFKVGGRWYQANTFEAYGDGIYHRVVKEKGVLCTSNCNIIGYPGANYSRIGVTYEFSTTSYKARIEHCRIDNYSRAVHIEENSNIDLTIENCTLVGFWIGVYSLGSLGSARLRILNSYLQYGTGTFNSSAGWTANGSNLPTVIRGCYLTVSTTAFAANAGTNHVYTDTTFDYNSLVSTLSNHTATFTNCSFINIVTPGASYYFFSGTQRFRGCTFSGTANVAFGLSGGTPFAEVSNSVSFGPLLVATQAQDNRYEGFTPSSNLLAPGFRSNNGTAIYGPSRYNTFPDSDYWIGQGTANVTGGLSFTASKTTVPSPIWENLSKATLIVKWSDGTPVYRFTQAVFNDPTAYGAGYYHADLKRNAAGNWVADGVVTTKGAPSASGMQGTTADSLTWTATGGFAFIIDVMIIPRHMSTYIL